MGINMDAMGDRLSDDYVLGPELLMLTDFFKRWFTTRHLST